MARSPHALPTAGQFRHYVEIQANTPTASGDSWAKVRDQWALVEALSGQALEMAQARGSAVRYRITLRDAPAVTAGQRIVYRSVTYEIESVVPYLDRLQQAFCIVVP